MKLPMKLVYTLALGVALVLTGACSSKKDVTAKNEVEAKVPVYSEMNRADVEKRWGDRINDLEGKINDLRKSAMTHGKKYDGSHAKLRRAVRNAEQELAQVRSETRQLASVSAAEFEQRSHDVDNRLDQIDHQLDSAKTAE